MVRQSSNCKAYLRIVNLGQIGDEPDEITRFLGPIDHFDGHKYATDEQAKTLRD